MKKLTENKYNLYSLAVAVVAIVLSQFKPLYTYFEQPEFEIKPISEIKAYPSPFEGTVFELDFNVANVGDKAGRIKDIKLLFIGSDGKVNIASTRRYLSPQEGVPMFAGWKKFYTVNLDVGQDWDKKLLFTVNYPNEMLDYANRTRDLLLKEELYHQTEVRDFGDWIDFVPSTILQNSLSELARKSIAWFVSDEYTVYLAVVAEHTTYIIPYSTTFSVVSAASFVSLTDNANPDMEYSYQRGINLSLTSRDSDVPKTIYNTVSESYSSYRF